MMFSWRAKRQLAALLFVVAVLGVAWFFAVQPFLPGPTCTDGRRNQHEIGIDCGGPCGPCEVRNPLPFTIFWSRAVAVGERMYDVAAEIQNQNETLSAASLAYRFVMRDQRGEIATISGTTFVYPQERLHIAETIRLDREADRIPTEVAFEIVDATWELREIERPNIVVEQRDYSVREVLGKKQSTVEARLANRTDFDFRNAEARILVFDKEQNLLGASLVVFENFESRSVQTVQATWPITFPRDPGPIIVEARANALDRLNFIVPGE